MLLWLTTGMSTEFGKVANLTQGIEEEKSPLQKEMVHVTTRVTIVAVSVGILFFLILITLTTVTLAESFIFALGMIVAFVPEGLLPTVTLSLATWFPTDGKTKCPYQEVIGSRNTWLHFGHLYRQNRYPDAK